jgi:hypothetical protein
MNSMLGDDDRQRSIGFVSLLSFLGPFRETEDINHSLMNNKVKELSCYELVFHALYKHQYSLTIVIIVFAHFTVPRSAP